MTSIYLNSPSPLPYEEGNGEGPQTSIFSCPVFFNPAQEQELNYNREGHPQQQQLEEFSIAESSQHHFLHPIIDGSAVCKRENVDDDPCENGSVKWMSSKMRLMRKMMNSNPQIADKAIGSMEMPPLHENNNNSSNNTVRVCTDCNTTKTPLWRGGPRGPKSLCNACGIRQRKARRAMAAAAAAAAGGLIATKTCMKSAKVKKQKRSEGNCPTQYKKRCKIAMQHTSKKLCLDEFLISLSENSAFHQVFPQDEKEAAILLMALSCGLVHS
eukprot:TRINITY_DN1427_c0_g1_i1.p1 TRINITY_DN1427_c0_g1~~TRINITY_DN1427_c0_g1_i1.p1  ORF type:complete len:270 (+),score=37.21 TRINITY_DN1427_c0_g1_i1:489-1298(+)